MIHELSPRVVAADTGCRSPHSPLPLGDSPIERNRRRPAGSFGSAAGPALSLVLAAAGYGLMRVVRQAHRGHAVTSSGGQLVVGIFNLLLAALDGGRMLRAVIWKLTGRPADLRPGPRLAAVLASGVRIGRWPAAGQLPDHGATASGAIQRQAREQVEDPDHQVAHLSWLTSVPAMVPGGTTRLRRSRPRRAPARAPGPLPNQKLPPASAVPARFRKNPPSGGQDARDRQPVSAGDQQWLSSWVRTDTYSR